ncbi:MAG: serine/threonine protein kinase, partial [Deltaproteobacteria bacterium]|nr:serine/threonine protein kinase [Deltaproteobacteria bacterium]
GGPPLAGLLGPGAKVGARYRVEEQLGVGGAAVVYRVWDEELDEPVALKILNAPVSDAKQIERFRQELRLARRLAHRNVVRLHDIGVHEGFRYLTMELLSGRDLRRWLDKGATRGLVLGWLLQAAEGLDAAHREGVVHRDVKPENLFIGEDGVVKVMDFGIARATDLRSVTAQGVFAGTPSYIAPEQITSFSVAGPAADLYSLAVVAYEALCGRVPFDQPTLPALLLAHTQQPPPSPRQWAPEMPAQMERELYRGLAKDPKQRHPDCVTFVRSLLAVSPWLPPGGGPARG